MKQLVELPEPQVSGSHAEATQRTELGTEVPPPPRSERRSYICKQDKMWRGGGVWESKRYGSLVTYLTGLYRAQCESQGGQQLLQVAAPRVAALQGLLCVCLEVVQRLVQVQLLCHGHLVAIPAHQQFVSTCAKRGNTCTFSRSNLSVKIAWSPYLHHVRSVFD